jgi:hypothetical protein
MNYRTILGTLFFEQSSSIEQKIVHAACHNSGWYDYWYSINKRMPFYAEENKDEEPCKNSVFLPR